MSCGGGKPVVLLSLHAVRLTLAQERQQCVNVIRELQPSIETAAAQLATFPAVMLLI